MQLEPPYLANLFETLIIPKEKTIAAVVETQPKPQTKAVVVVINQPNKAEEQDLLEKVLGSINLTIADVTVFENTTAENLPELLSHGAKTAICFGLALKEVALYRPEHQHGVKIINCDSLEAINADRELKIKLWNCLKHEFLKS